METNSNVSIIGLFNYIKFCWLSFQQNEACLFHSVDKNASIVLSPEMLPHFDENAASILELENEQTELQKFKNTSEFLNELFYDFFSRTQKSLKPIQMAAEKLHFLMIENVKKIVHAKMNLQEFGEIGEAIVQHWFRLKKFNIYDIRIELSCKFLFLLFKKKVFKFALERFNILFNQMNKKGPTKINKGQIKSPIFFDFFAIVNESLGLLKKFQEIQNFDFVLVEFIRKLFFYYFNHLILLIDKRILDFEFSYLVDVMINFEYCQKESTLICQNEKDENAEFFNKYVDGLIEKLHDKLAVCLLTKTASVIKDKLRKVELNEFKIEIIISRYLEDVESQANKMPPTLKTKMIHLIHRTILEIYIELVYVNQKNDFTCSKAFKDQIHLIIWYFKTHSNYFDAESFVHFIECYQTFLECQNRTKCEILLGILKTILGSDLNDQVIYKITDTKNYTSLKFTSRIILTNFKASIFENKIGVNKGLKKQKHRIIFEQKLYTLYKVFVLVKKLKKAIKKPLFNKSNSRKLFFEVGDCLEKHQINWFSESCQMYFLKKEEFFSFSKPRVLDFIDNLQNGNQKMDCNFKFENQNLIVTDRHDKLIKIFSPAKIDSLQKINRNKYNAISFINNKLENVFIFFNKPQNQETVFEKLNQITSIFEMLCFNKER